MQKLGQPIDSIIAYLNNGSSRWVTSSEIAIAIYGLSPYARIKGPKVRVQRAISDSHAILSMSGIKIEVSRRGYRMIRK